MFSALGTEGRRRWSLPRSPLSGRPTSSALAGMRDRTCCRTSSAGAVTPRIRSDPHVHVTGRTGRFAARHLHRVRGASSVRPLRRSRSAARRRTLRSRCSRTSSTAWVSLVRPLIRLSAGALARILGAGGGLATSHLQAQRRGDPERSSLSCPPCGGSGRGARTKRRPHPADL